MANGNLGGTARWKYGLIALGIGAGTILTALLIVGLVWDKDEGALAAVTGAVGTIVGAYFGLQVGGAEAEDAKKQRDEAGDKKDAAMQANAALAAKLPDAEATPVLEQYGLR
jgi:hypothetical protein